MKDRLYHLLNNASHELPEAESLSDQEVMNIMKRFKEEKPITEKRIRRKPRAKMVILAAAIITACMGTAMVTAASGRNFDILAKWFSTNESDDSSDMNQQVTPPLPEQTDTSDAIAQEMLAPLAEPTSYSNGKVQIIVEAEYDDGMRHMLLLSAVDSDGNPVNMAQQGSGSFVRYADGTLATIHHDASGFGAVSVDAEDVNRFEMEYYACSVACADFAEKDLYLSFENYDQSPSIFDEIRIPLKSGQNVALESFTAADGTACYVSGFEVILPISDKHDLPDTMPYLTMLDGEQLTVSAKYASTTQEIDANSHIVFTEHSWIDVDNVQEVTFNGKTYTKE